MGHHHGSEGLGCVILLVVLVLQVGIGGGVGYLIGKGKGLGTVGFILGLILGLIGWLITALLPGQPTYVPVLRRRRLMPAPVSPGGPTKPCPYCQEPIRVGARLCRFCKSAL